MCIGSLLDPNTKLRFDLYMKRAGLFMPRADGGRLVVEVQSCSGNFVNLPLQEAPHFDNQAFEYTLPACPNCTRAVCPHKGRWRVDDEGNNKRILEAEKTDQGTSLDEAGSASTRPQNPRQGGVLDEHSKGKEEAMTSPTTGSKRKREDEEDVWRAVDEAYTSTLSLRGERRDLEHDLTVADLKCKQLDEKVTRTLQEVKRAQECHAAAAKKHDEACEAKRKVEEKLERLTEKAALYAKKSG